MVPFRLLSTATPTTNALAAATSTAFSSSSTTPYIHPPHHEVLPSVKGGFPTLGNFAVGPHLRIRQRQPGRTSQIGKSSLKHLAVPPSSSAPPYLKGTALSHGGHESHGVLDPILEDILEELEFLRGVDGGQDWGGGSGVLHFRGTGPQNHRLD